jgi:hypothetical protein
MTEATATLNFKGSPKRKRQLEYLGRLLVHRKAAAKIFTDVEQDGLEYKKNIQGVMLTDEEVDALKRSR